MSKWNLYFKKILNDKTQISYYPSKFKSKIIK